ncbi:MAG: transporter [Phycisphaerales bacterium]|nr:transporter [Phycisphaerales bacterium]
MNDTIGAVALSVLVSVGVLAELNLVRLFMMDWRTSRREHSRTRCRWEATGSRLAASDAGVSVRRAPLAAALACGVVPQAALAQTSGLQQTLQPRPSATSAAASPIEGRLQLNADAVTRLQPPAATSEPVPAPPLIIATDRPSFSDTAGIAPVGHFQLETGYTFTLRDRDGVETHRHNGPELLARVGLLDDRLELRATTSGHVWSRTDDGTGAGFASTEGFSDVAVGFKLKLIDQDGLLPRLAVEGITTVGAGRRGISSGRAEPTIKLIWAYDLEKLWGDRWKGFGVYGNVNLAYPTTDGDRFVQGAASACGTYAINDTIGVFAEYYLLGPAAKGTDAAHSIDVGGTYLINTRTQLDARMGFGLNRTADNVYVGVGISVLF